jgi:lipid-binding SYLF domain-containing protein
MRPGFIAAALVMVGASATAGISTTEAKRVGDAARVLEEMRSVPDRSIAQDTWRRARCVAVIPGARKGALVVGGEYGEGFVSCRTPNGWSAPAYLALHEGSLGAQIGVESVDLVMLIMNQRGVDQLLQDHVTLGVTLGADVSIAAGPVGRDATRATDAQLEAEILSYSRARGLFAGIDLTGGILRPDARADRDLYGRAITAREILTSGHVSTPASTEPFVAALNTPE